MTRIVEVARRLTASSRSERGDEQQPTAHGARLPARAAQRIRGLRIRDDIACTAIAFPRHASPRVRFTTPCLVVHSAAWRTRRHRVRVHGRRWLLATRARGGSAHVSVDGRLLSERACSYESETAFGETSGAVMTSTRGDQADGEATSACARDRNGGGRSDRRRQLPCRYHRVGLREPGDRRLAHAKPRRTRRDHFCSACGGMHPPPRIAGRDTSKLAGPVLRAAMAAGSLTCAGGMCIALSAAHDTRTEPRRALR